MKSMYHQNASMSLNLLEMRPELELTLKPKYVLCKGLSDHHLTSPPWYCCQEHRVSFNEVATCSHHICTQRSCCQHPGQPCPHYVWDLCEMQPD